MPVLVQIYQQIVSNHIDTIHVSYLIMCTDKSYVIIQLLYDIMNCPWTLLQLQYDTMECL